MIEASDGSFIYYRIKHQICTKKRITWTLLRENPTASCSDTILHRNKYQSCWRVCTLPTALHSPNMETLWLCVNRGSKSNLIAQNQLIIYLYTSICFNSLYSGFRFRCIKHWLKLGDKRDREIFIENLPGGPDNINLAPDGSFWISLIKVFKIYI